MSKTIEVEINVKKSINDVQNIVKHGSNPFITVALDTHYKECIHNEDVPSEPIEPGMKVYCHATSEASGGCFFKDSKFGLYFYDNHGKQLGFAHFHEPDAGSWHAGETGIEIQATSSQPGYLISTKTKDDHGSTNHFTITISGEPATGS